jgi:glycerophosphoryl diester phosphodiesterase
MRGALIQPAYPTGGKAEKARACTARKVEHRALIERQRRADLHRPHPERAAALQAAAFPRLCAHRGLSHACPENTLPAFAAALAIPGVHEIELDLWLSRDGVPVVCHDPRVDRTTDGRGLVTELDWPVIASFDAGIRHGEVWRGLRLPRFEEVLDLVDGRAAMNIHIKDPGTGGRLVHLVVELLRRYGLDRLGYLAGDEDVLAAALDYAPDVGRNCLAHQGEPERLVATALQYRCSRLQFGRNVTAEAAAEAKARGLVRNLFWSDEVEDARRYVALGIDVILTNCAQRLAGRL